VPERVSVEPGRVVSESARDGAPALGAVAPLSQLAMSARVLALQRSAGNAAVAAILAREENGNEEEEEEEREGTGLAAAAPTETFAAAAVDFAQRNPDKSFEDLAKALFDHVKVLLEGIGSHPPELHFADAGALGVFNRADWKLVVNRHGDAGMLKDKKLSELSPAQLGDAADTIYHESRHSEQFFRIARMLFGRDVGKYAVMARTGIPFAVIEAAARNPLKGGDEATQRLIREAESWHDVTLGRFKGYMEGVKDLAEPTLNALKLAISMDRLATDRHRYARFIKTYHYEYLRLQPAIEKVEQVLFSEDDIPDSINERGMDLMTKYELLQQCVEGVMKAIETKPEVTQSTAQKVAERTQALRESRMKAYKAFAHEEDAYSVGGAVSSAVVRRLTPEVDDTAAAAGAATAVTSEKPEAAETLT